MKASIIFEDCEEGVKVTTDIGDEFTYETGDEDIPASVYLAALWLQNILEHHKLVDKPVVH